MIVHNDLHNALLLILNDSSIYITTDQVVCLERLSIRSRVFVLLLLMPRKPGPNRGKLKLPTNQSQERLI